MKKYFIFFLFAFIFSNILLLSWTGSGGPGDTKNNAYQIWSEADLIELFDSLHVEWERSYQSCWHCEKHFILMVDIHNAVVSTYGFVYRFYGHFHGRGKK